MTGTGCVSALGHSVPAFWAALREGRGGLGPMAEAAQLDLRVAVVGAIPPPEPSEAIDRRRLPMLDRFSVLALVAAGQAIAQSGLELGRMGHRTGCVVGVGTAGGETIDTLYRRLFVDGSKRATVFTVPRVMPSAPVQPDQHGAWACAARCSPWPRPARRPTTPSRRRCGCCGQRGDGRGGGGGHGGAADVWDPEGMGGAARDGARHVPPVRPQPEAAWSWPKAPGWWSWSAPTTPSARGATILAEIAGVGMSADAADLVAPTVEGAAAAIQACLADARLAPGDVDYVNAHGTGTMANDMTEIAAIKAVFGAEAARLSISSTKSMHGHALGASGSLELVAMIEAIRAGVVPPTMNINELDPACDLDVTPGVARERPIRAAISNAFAFGGTNAVVAVRGFAG